MTVNFDAPDVSFLIILDGMTISDRHNLQLWDTAEERTVGRPFTGVTVPRRTESSCQAGAKARLKAAQTMRCAFIASSTAGTMPKKGWIIPGNSLYSTGTPARPKASA